MSFLIRSALPGDAAAIETVRMASWQVAYRGIMPDALLDGLEPRTEMVRKRAEWLADGTTTAEEFSTGMGRALMAATVDRAGAAELGLWVLRDNARARRFYERAGFTPSGRARTEGDPPLAEVHYRRAG
ncbi:GNAT family N-acetyltransferase [Nonomuraea sp. NN258]|uniref:GNAT family N-acetyltransferase n=1 Tax=Nonomuraea antri TaxID=2730852 RepID=UPI00156A48E7|nr:GNAT family N-acetyltransferase [Nonomuraea antri]NRQ36763.1 GNAT family N-acetyltransferase [Nonomuraea antri]